MAPDAQRRLAAVGPAPVPRPVPASRRNGKRAAPDLPQHRVMVGYPVTDDMNDLAFLLDAAAHRDHRRRHDLAPIDVEAIGPEDAVGDTRSHASVTMSS